MKHFYYYPTVEYGTETLVNIMVRGKIRDAILQRTVLYYDYKIQEGQRPDIVAEKYYGNTRYTWAIFYANNMFHPTLDWPMDGQELTKYLIAKYGVSYPRGSLAEIKHYEMYNKETKQRHIIDRNSYVKHWSPAKTYVPGPSSGTYQIKDSLTGDSYIIDDYTFSTTYSDKTIMTRAVSYYDYELEKNEEKRNIVVLDKEYLSQLTNEFITLFK